MKSAKIFFGLAIVALLGAVGCVVAFLFAPEPAPVAEENIQEQEIVEESNDSIEKTEEMLSEEAAEEVARFLAEYDMVIPHEEMLEQVKIRYDYEKKYGTTYTMEEIFLAEVPEDESVGDPSDDTLEKIQQYVELYNIDESRYASMTAQEELDALEVEYGPLPDETVNVNDGTDETSLSVEEGTGETLEENVPETQQRTDEQNSEEGSDSPADTDTTQGVAE